jgi:hypothetical protein
MKCHALIQVAQELERKMDLPVGDSGKPAGQFIRRPGNLLSIVDEPFAAALIYPAVLAAWTYLALYNYQSRDWLSLGVFLAGFTLILLYDWSLRKGPKPGDRRAGRTRAAAGKRRPRRSASE